MNTSEIKIGERVVVGQARVNGATVPDEFTGRSGAVLEVDGSDVLVQSDTDDRAGLWIRAGRLVPAASQPLPAKTAPTPAQLAVGYELQEERLERNNRASAAALDAELAAGGR